LRRLKGASDHGLHAAGKVFPELAPAIEGGLVSREVVRSCRTAKGAAQKLRDELQRASGLAHAGRITTRGDDRSRGIGGSVLGDLFRDRTVAVDEQPRDSERVGLVAKTGPLLLAGQGVGRP